MRNVVIVDSVRTGLQSPSEGSTKQELTKTAHLVSAFKRNPSLKPEMVEDMILGCGAPEGAKVITYQEMSQYYQIFQLKLVEQQLTDTVHQVYKLLQWLLTRLLVIDCIMAGGVESITPLKAKLTCICM